MSNNLFPGPVHEDKMNKKDVFSRLLWVCWDRAHIDIDLDRRRALQREYDHEFTRHAKIWKHYQSMHKSWIHERSWALATLSSMLSFFGDSGMLKELQCDAICGMYTCICCEFVLTLLSKLSALPSWEVRLSSVRHIFSFKDLLCLVTTWHDFVL